MNYIKVLSSIDSIKDFESTEKAESYIISFYDNKACSFLTTEVVPHVIDSIRNIGKFLKAVSLPISDIDIVIVGGIDSLHVPFGLNFVKVEPSAYFPELDKDVSVDSSGSENVDNNNEE